MVLFSMTDEMKRFPLIFYATEGGSEPVREWLKELPTADRRKVGEELKTLEYGWPIGMPTVRPLGNGLYELRVSLHRRIARVMVCPTKDQKLVALHAFIKKTQTTPKADLDLAKDRKKTIETKTAKAKAKKTTKKKAKKK